MIYTAITVNRIDKKADNLKALIFLEGNWSVTFVLAQVLMKNTR